MARRKEYSNGEITVVWEPKKCIHSGICVRTLPEVYNPKERPWVKINNATTEELRNQVKKCPTGALSYFMNGEENLESESLETKVEVMPNGPLMIYGTLNITDQNGNASIKNKTTAFCRCGKSENKPYCDGMHVKIDFRD